MADWIAPLSEQVISSGPSPSIGIAASMSAEHRAQKRATEIRHRFRLLSEYNETAQIVHKFLGGDKFLLLAILLIDIPVCLLSKYEDSFGKYQSRDASGESWCLYAAKKKLCIGIASSMSA